jgi:hypothetical protein
MNSQDIGKVKDINNVRAYYVNTEFQIFFLKLKVLIKIQVLCNMIINSNINHRRDLCAKKCGDRMLDVMTQQLKNYVISYW